MTEAIVYLGLGSNLGDRARHLEQALTLLSETVLLEIVSSIYETPPWGYLEQPAFLNAVCQVSSALSPEALLRELQRIEAGLGRQRLQHWGPRTLDLDILFYDDLVIETPTLTIPHLLLHERAFVLVPLAEIAPQLGHPRLGRTVSELLAQVGERKEVRLWSPPTRIWPDTGERQP